MIKEVEEMLRLTPAKQRNFLDHYSDDELINLKKNLEDLLQRRKEQEELERLQEKEKQEKSKKILEQMSEMGLTIDDLSSEKKPLKGSKIPPKYRLVIDGKEHTWTGRGRIPKVFSQYEKDNGKNSLSDLETDNRFVLDDSINKK